LSLFVDTSVWSLALRRDRPADAPEIGALERAPTAGELATTTGLVYQQLLQGFHGPRDQRAIVERFAALPLLKIQVVARSRAETTACYSWTIFEPPRPQYRSFSSRL
jgi:predicted nucleic acid-binding protein